MLCSHFLASKRLLLGVVFCFATLSCKKSHSKVASEDGGRACDAGCSTENPDICIGDTVIGVGQWKGLMPSADRVVSFCEGGVTVSSGQGYNAKFLGKCSSDHGTICPGDWIIGIGAGKQKIKQPVGVSKIDAGMVVYVDKAGKEDRISPADALSISCDKTCSVAKPEICIGDWVIGVGAGKSHVTSPVEVVSTCGISIGFVDKTGVLHETNEKLLGECGSADPTSCGK
ncbi:MAG: hypothetical protein AB7T49_04110 [Oligoflexales bacterium]